MMVYGVHMGFLIPAAGSMFLIFIVPVVLVGIVAAMGIWRLPKDRALIIVISFAIVLGWGILFTFFMVVVPVLQDYVDHAMSH